MVTYPITSQTVLDRVYTRNVITKDLFIQYYTLVTDPIEFYTLKDTHYNQLSKTETKYIFTNMASAIIKCLECELHDLLSIQQTLFMTHKNFKDKPICLFKQAQSDVRILPIKSYQLYKDIILLKQPIKELLVLLDTNTNLLFPSIQIVD